MGADIIARIVLAVKNITRNRKNEKKDGVGSFIERHFIDRTYHRQDILKIEHFIDRTFHR